MDFKRTRSHFHPRGPARRAPRQTSIGPKRTSWRSGWRAAPDGGTAGWDGRRSPRARPRGHTILRMTTATDYDDLLWMRRALDLARTVMYTTVPNPGSAASSSATDACWAKARPSRRAARTPRCAPCAMPRPVARRWRAPPSMSRWSRAAITAAPPLRGRRAGRAARVVVAIGDPNPLVNGQGLARLRAAGIAVTTGVCQEESAGAQCGLHLPHESRAALGLDEDGGFAGWPQRVA